MQRRYWASLEDINRILHVTNIIDPLYPNAVPIEDVRVAKVKTDNAVVETKIKIDGNITTPLTFACGSAANPSVRFTRAGGIESNGLYYTPNGGIGVSVNGHCVGEIGANGFGTIGFTSNAQSVDFHNATATHACYAPSAYSFDLSNAGGDVMSDQPIHLITIPMRPAPNKSIVLSVKMKIDIFLIDGSGFSCPLVAQFIAHKIDGNLAITISDTFNETLPTPVIIFSMSDLISIVGGTNEIIISKKAWYFIDPRTGEREPPRHIIVAPHCEIQRVDY